MQLVMQTFGEAARAVQARSWGGISQKHSCNDKVFGRLDKAHGQNWSE